MLVAPPGAPFDASPGAHSPEATDLLDLVAGAERVVLAGHPQPAARTPGSASTVFQPKEILLELAQAGLCAGGGPAIQLTNPHFLRIADWSDGLAVLHFSALDLTCPVPLARNIQVLDGEDLLGLAEERRLGDRAGLRRQRLGLMDHVLGLGPVPSPVDGAGASPLVGAGASPLVGPEISLLVLGPLLAQAARLPLEGARPVQWCDCDMETGPYNFLQLRRQPKLRTTHVRVLLDTAKAVGSARGARPTLVAFATPQGLAELGPVLRAFAALPGAAEATGPLLQVFFFGTPEELVSALADRPQASFFGDNFRCPGIRFLFAPFAARDLLEMVANAAGTVESCYGGVLDALACAMRVPARLVMGPDGGFDAWRDGQAVASGIDWGAIHAAETLADRRHKADRGQERRLFAALAAMAA